MVIFKQFSDKVKKAFIEQKQKRVKQIKEEFERRKDLRKRKKDKLRVLMSLTNKELSLVVRKFISSNPKIQMVSESGKITFRKPNRGEMVDGILQRVALASVFFAIPRIDPKKKEVLKKKILRPIKRKIAKKFKSKNI